MAPAYEPELWQELTAAASASSSSSNVGSSSVAASSSIPGRKRAVPGPPKAPQQQQQQQQAQSIADVPIQLLASTVLNQQQQQRQPSGLAASSCRPSQLRLAVKFRVNKKMLLTDVLLAAPVPRAQLEQQWQQLVAYRAASAAARLSPSRVDASVDGSDNVLPWQC
jgi:hypothetical protein